MKTNLSLIVILLLASISAHAMQIDVPSLTVLRKDSSNTYIIKYTHMTTGNVVLTMTDAKGHMLLRKKIQYRNSFLTPINLSSFAHGNYIINADNGTSNTVVTIRYNNDTEPTYTRVASHGDSTYTLASTLIGRQASAVKVYEEEGHVVIRDPGPITWKLATRSEFNALEHAMMNAETSGNSLMGPAPHRTCNKLG